MEEMKHKDGGTWQKGSLVPPQEAARGRKFVWFFENSIISSLFLLFRCAVPFPSCLVLLLSLSIFLPSYLPLEKPFPFTKEKKRPTVAKNKSSDL